MMAIDGHAVKALRRRIPQSLMIMADKVIG
jgi:hypothetical protein